MKDRDKLISDISFSAKNVLLEMLGDSFKDINHNRIIGYAVEDMFKTDSVEENGLYYKGDVYISVQRSLAYNLQESEDRVAEENKLVLTNLKENKDYEHVNLSDEEMKTIFKNTEGICDLDIVQIEMNKLLLKFGYDFDPERLQWIKRIEG